jgi:hypothetical protein
MSDTYSPCQYCGAKWVGATRQHTPNCKALQDPDEQQIELPISPWTWEPSVTNKTSEPEERTPCNCPMDFMGIRHVETCKDRGEWYDRKTNSNGNS